jgi:hypothetical protein
VSAIDPLTKPLDDFFAALMRAQTQSFRMTREAAEASRHDERKKGNEQ